MIESRFWKDDLLKHVKALKPVKHPSRWSEKKQVNFEKEIIISFFKIRKLFETNRVSSASRKYNAKIFRYPVGEKKVNKETIVAALGKFRERADAAVPHIIPLLNTKDEWIRWSAIIALGRIGRSPDETIPLLLPRLHDTDERLRIATCTTLARFGHRALPATVALTALLDDDALDVSDAALEALSRIEP